MNAVNKTQTAPLQEHEYMNVIFNNNNLALSFSLLNHRWRDYYVMNFVPIIQICSFFLNRTFVLSEKLK